jgi:glycosyltransferase involved in cell wall biosynthesis
MLRAPLGGLFRHVCDLIEEQNRMGHAVGIVCDSLSGGAQAEEQLARMAPACALGILRLPMSRMLGRSDFQALRRIRAHVAALVPDILHGHGAKGGAYARLVPAMTGRVAVYTPHGGSLHYSRFHPAGAIFLGLEQYLRERGDGLLFESQFAADVYAQKIGTGNCPARVVLNGLRDVDFVSLDDSEPVYDAVFVGELRKLKGVAVLIEACALLNAERPFRLGIAGTGPNEAMFRALVAAKGLTERVEFLGHAHAQGVFRQGRMVVIPSLAESFPYVALEAMACGRPVVATNVGGIPEIFGPHVDALVPAGDPSALAGAMRDTRDCRTLAKSQAIALLRRARSEFSAARMAAEITDFYSELKTLSLRRAGRRAEPVKARETTAA